MRIHTICRSHLKVSTPDVAFSQPCSGIAELLEFHEFLYPVDAAAIQMALIRGCLVWGKWGLKRGLDKTCLTRDPCGHRAHREPAYDSKTRCANVLAGGCVTQTAACGASITSNEEATQETWELWCSFCCLCLLGQVMSGCFVDCKSLELNPLKHVCTFDLCGLVSLCWKRFRTCLCHGGKGSGNSLGYPENSNPLDYIRRTISSLYGRFRKGYLPRATFLGLPTVVIPCNVVQRNGMEWNLM